MIPASQRADGTWRKSRKIREGGPTRYLPPALRGDPSERPVASTRSLDDFRASAHASVRKVSTSPLTAALFILLLEETGMSHGTEQSTISDNLTSSGRWSREGKTGLRSKGGTTSTFNRSTQQQHVGDDAADQGPALHPATSYAHDYLKCRGNRRLSVRNDAASGDGKEDDIWWAKLKQVTQSWSQAPETLWGDGREWVGLELSLRSSDIASAEGQQGIVEFLHGVVASGGDSREHPRASETGLDNVWVSYTSNSNAGHAGGNVAGANRGDGGGRSTRNTAKTFAKRKCTESGPKPRREEGEKEEEVVVVEEEGKDHDLIRVKGRNAVGAVLMCSTLLSKRDRAELHGQAQLADGITSGSYGVGDARFLVLTCGFEELKTEVDVELSHEKEALAKNLYLLAQGEYHSRYERMSHREIREVVASGGPTQEKHPDLFRLLEKHEKPALSGYGKGLTGGSWEGSVARSRGEGAAGVSRSGRQHSDRGIGKGVGVEAGRGTSQRSEWQGRPPSDACPW